MQRIDMNMQAIPMIRTTSMKSEKKSSHVKMALRLAGLESQPMIMKVRTRNATWFILLLLISVLLRPYKLFCGRKQTPHHNEHEGDASDENSELPENLDKNFHAPSLNDNVLNPTCLAQGKNGKPFRP
jgi:hypothetical protein